jgi:hypothetical protein
MKLVLVAIATLVSLSLGGGPFNPNPLNTSLLALSDSAPQLNQQTSEVSPDVRAQLIS